VLLSFATPLVGECGGWLNIFKGPEDYKRNHEAEVLKDGINESINDELHGLPPSGFITKGYSREVWDISWNNQINALYKFEEDPSMKSYRGPTGAEFIRYIIKTRREKGLPEINIEERNKGIIEKINEIS
jgi:hypothetical protein